MQRHELDITDGEIIGGDHQTGWLTYDGRRQLQNFTADTLDDLRAEGRRRIEMMRKEYGEHFERMFPKGLWRLCIDEGGRRV